MPTGPPIQHILRKIQHHPDKVYPEDFMTVSWVVPVSFFSLSLPVSIFNSPLPYKNKTSKIVKNTFERVSLFIWSINRISLHHFRGRAMYSLQRPAGAQCLAPTLRKWLLPQNAVKHWDEPTPASVECTAWKWRCGLVCKAFCICPQT